MSERNVFTDKFIAEVNRKYGHLSCCEQPDIFFYATLPGWRELRIEVERLTSSLPLSSHSKNIISRLHSKEQFLETYHELVIGDLFQRWGYTIEYEKKLIHKLTPDWFIFNSNIPPMAVEVFTINPPEAFRRERKQWLCLLFALEELLGSAIINISYSDGTSAPACEESKKIVTIVEEWLSTKPSVGDKTVVDGITFEVINYDERHQKVVTEGLAVNMIIEPDRLRFKINDEKVEKYKVLKDNGIPLVITVVPMLASGLSMFSLENILFGNDGLFDGTIPTDSALSAVLWIPVKLQQSLDVNKMAIYCNPAANHPLLPQTFPVNTKIC